MKASSCFENNFVTKLKISGTPNNLWACSEVNCISFPVLKPEQTDTLCGKAIFKHYLALRYPPPRSLYTAESRCLHFRHLWHNSQFKSCSEREFISFKPGREKTHGLLTILLTENQLIGRPQRN